MSSVGDLTARVRSLRRSSILRLTLLLSAIFAVGMTVAVLVALHLGRGALIDRIDATLAAALAADDTPRVSNGLVIRPTSAPGDLPGGIVRTAAEGGGTVELDDDYRQSETWRVIVAADSEGASLLVAAPLDDNDDALELLGGILWTTAALVVLGALAIGLVAGLLAQRRLSLIGATLDRLAGGDLRARTGVARDGDDLDDLARQLDGTAADLERLVAQTRHLSASLAHDLRTPLARLRARLDALPVGEARADALEEADRLSLVFNVILRIARIDATQGKDGFQTVDLGALVVEVGETYAPVFHDRGKRLIVEQTGAKSVFADRGMMVQALANLLQNALVHGGANVTLFARDRAIGVADDGAGVDPAQLAEIVQPMVRLEAAREGDGAGLGLALVRAVADRHGARLDLSPEHPHGLCVSLDFADS